MPSRALYKLAVAAGLAAYVVSTDGERPSRGDEPKKVEERGVVEDKAAAEKAAKTARDAAAEELAAKARKAGVVPSVRGEAKKADPPPAANKADAEKLAKMARDGAAEKLAVRARGAVVVADGDDPVVAQWEQQFAPMFRQLFKAELHFMRLVTDATKEQYDAVAADGEAAVKSAIRKYANAMQRGGEYADPRLGITDAIGKSIEKHFSPEQAALYRKEIELRTAAQEKLIVTNLVAMIDRILLLRPDQREKINDILANNWHDSWNQTQILMYGGRYMPLMPNDKIDPILTDKQREVWRGIPKNQVRFGPNFGFNQGFQIDDEVWDDDPPAKKADKPVPPKGKP